MVRLLVAAFDGLLPQQVNPELTPTINSLASAGVRFTRHHAVFPTVTRVNSAAMVTGCYSGKHGIPANTAVFADHDPNAPMQVLEPQLAAMAANPETPVLFVPTIGELLDAAGMTHVSVVGGSSGNAYVHFPQASSNGRGGVIHPEFSLPAELGKADEAALGPWPGPSVPGIERANRVADSACKFVIPEINPDLLFVWFPEPDGANHAHGLGSEESNQGIGVADAALGRILETLKGRGDDPDVMVVSDHGYSTITEAVDVFGELNAGGYDVDPANGRPVTSVNGGSVLFDFPGADTGDIESLMTWLNERPWAGAVFSSLPAANQFGALPVETAFMAGKRAPHFVVSMAWQDQPGQNGFDGTAFNGGGAPPGAGLHGSASPYEMRNTLIASGPSFKRGLVSDVPSGNVDVTPTALQVLGQPVPTHMDGRVLEEALASGSDPDEMEVSERVIWGQSSSKNSDSPYFARVVSVGDHAYLDSAGVGDQYETVTRSR